MLDHHEKEKDGRDGLKSEFESKHSLFSPRGPFTLQNSTGKGAYMVSLASVLTNQNKSMGILCSETRPRKKDNAAKSVSSLRKIQAVTPYRITAAPPCRKKEKNMLLT